MARVSIRGRRSGPRRSRWQRFLGKPWSPPQVALQFPDKCPHCLDASTQVVAVWATTKYVGNRSQDLAYEVPVCSQMRTPVWSYLLGVFFVFVAVTAGLAAISTGIVPAIIATGALAAAWQTWRHRGWIRFVGYDQETLYFRVRRAAYAYEFAELNNGTVSHVRARHRLPRAQVRAKPSPSLE